MLGEDALLEIIDPLPFIDEQPKIKQRVWPLPDAYERVPFPVYYGWIEWQQNSFSMGDGEPALIFPVYLDGCVVDLGAVGLKSPHSALMLDSQPAFGMHHWEQLQLDYIDAPIDGGPFDLNIFSSGGRWLRSGCDGVYILDAAFYRVLAYSPWMNLKCETPELAKLVEARIMDNLQIAPRIGVM